MKVETTTNEALPETATDEAELEQITFFLPKEQKEWLMDRKRRGESASTILRVLVRKAMEAQEPVVA